MPITSVTDEHGLRCIANAITADIPEQDAGAIADMFQLKRVLQPTLMDRWLTLDSAANPERHAQVATRERQICPDIASP